MAGTAKGFNTSKFIKGPVDLWEIDVPADGAYITLDATTGTPDSTAHPTAKHFGHTDSGVSFKASAGEAQKIFVDELKTPALIIQGGEGAASLSGSWTQLNDADLLVRATPGAGTKFTATGKTGIKGGTLPIAYISVAAIFPLLSDPTKFGVIQLYKCFNTAGLEAALNSKDIARSPFNFEGSGITSRTATDSIFVFWWMT